MNIYTALLRILVVLFLNATVSTSFAETIVSAYQVRDMISGRIYVEKFDLHFDPKYPEKLRTESVVTIDQVINTSETITATPFWWLRIIKADNENIRYHEFLSFPPDSLEPGETSFGYIYVKDSITNEIKESWPLFLSVTDIGGVWRKAVSVLYISNNRKMEITRLYSRNNYFFPVTQTIKIYKPGVDPLTIPQMGGDENYEAYVVSRRID
jgi:hypothetical protein